MYNFLQMYMKSSNSCTRKKVVFIVSMYFEIKKHDFKTPSWCEGG